jgi:hypothetical protein
VECAGPGERSVVLMRSGIGLVLEERQLTADRGSIRW